jgi:D-amino-acid dehydrogenase
MPWLVGYWRHSSPHLYPAAIAGALPLIENSWTEHAPLIEAAGVSRLVNQNGWIKVWRHQDTEQASLDQAKQSLAYGLSVKVLSNAELQIKEPGLDPALIGGVHYPDSRQIHDPQALTTAYLNLFLQRGGRFIRGDAQSLQRDGQRWQVTTDEGPHSADAAVVALGPWGEDLAQKLGYQLKMGRKRGYHMHFAARGTAPTHVIVDVDNGYALAPMQQGIRLTTGAEFALRDAPPTPVQLDRIEPIARTLYSLGARLDQQAWMGSRPCTIDMLPVLGPAPKHPGLWFCFGHAHHGLTQAAASARLLAEMICGRETFADPKPYRVDRF